MTVLNDGEPVMEDRESSAPPMSSLNSDLSRSKNRGERPFPTLGHPDESFSYHLLIG